MLNAQNLYGGQQHYRIGDSNFPDVSQSDVADMFKALAAGSDIDSPGAVPGSGFPQRIEWLDSMLHVESFAVKDAKFIRKVFMDQAKNTVVEYNTWKDYGADVAAFMTEGGVPAEHDMTLERLYARMKYVGTLRRVTHPMDIIQAAHERPQTLAMEAATRWLLRALEYNSFFADSAVVPQEFDGIEAQIIAAVAAGDTDADAIVDLRGRNIGREDIEEVTAVRYEQPNNAELTDFYMSVTDHRKLTQEIHPEERYSIGADGRTLTPGIRMLDYQTATLEEPVMMNPDKFIERSKVPLETGAGTNGARPAPSTIVVQPISPAAILPEVSQFDPDDEGTYIYRVVAENEAGLSQPTNTNGVIVSAGDVVKFTIQDNEGASGYRIYRTKVDVAVTTATFIKRIPRGTSTMTQFVDENSDLPGTTKIFGLQNDRSALTVWQLLPMARWNLAAVDTSIRWAQIIYTTGPRLTLKRKHMMFKNAGQA